jgi:hypothetical protein
MNIPADLRLCVRVLDILAGEQLRYKSASGFDSRTEKAAHRVMSEDRIAAWTGEPGVWYVASESKKVYHLVSAPDLTCDCEDHEQSRTRHARSGICHHIIVAALCEAGRLEAEEAQAEARAEWERLKEQYSTDRRNAYEDEITAVFGAR